MNISKRLLLIGMVATLFATNCADLTIDNLNEPNTKRALSSVADLESLAENLYQNFYSDTYDTDTPGSVFATVADNMTCSWGNYGMRATSSEPRTSWDNTVSFPYEASTSEFFNEMYAILASASDVLRAMDNDVDFGSAATRIEAWSKFNQALVFSNIALTFDQGYIITEDTPDAEILNPVLQPASAIAAKAEALFDEVIALSASSFTLPETYINGISGGDNVFLAQLANSYAARLLTYMPRNPAEDANVNWAKVKTYATNGIDADFMVLMDDTDWLNDYQWIVAYPGWGRTDMRTISMMDSSYPSHNAAGADFAAPDSATVVDDDTKDNRLLTDFSHLASNNFRPERGLYHFSSFRFSRYDDYISTWTTELPELKKAEVDMLLAEAELQLGNVQAAADIVNAGTRTTRGGLANVAATADAVRDAITHERFVELAVTSYGLQYFDQRKRNDLQEGTFTQLPIPAKILELLQTPKPYYTFGGDNPSSSTGGWR